MKTRVFLGFTVALAVLAFGALIGSVAGGALAQASQGAAATAADTPSPSTGTTPPSTAPAPAPDMPFDKGMPFGPGPMMGGFGGPGMKGHMGRGEFGGGRFDGGPFGMRANAEGAGAAIGRATDRINLAKGDLTYATGKMDTANVQKWLNGADSLLNTAKTANTNSQYERAIAYAQAAGDLAMVAESQMAQTLGADKLPSYTQNQRPHPPMPNQANATVSQAQASRMLAQTYDRLITVGALLNSAGTKGDAATYLTDAQNAYKTAYSAYQAGKYTDAIGAAKLAEQLSHVAEQLAHAARVTDNPDTPVTVPAPNF